MTNTLIFMSGLVLQGIALMLVVSTIETHNWSSISFGIVIGSVGIVTSLYGMGLAELRQKAGEQ